MVVMTVTLDSQNKDDDGGGDERDLRDDRDTLISSKKGEEEEKRSDVACDGIMPAVKKTHLPNAIKPQFPRRKPTRRNNHE